MIDFTILAVGSMKDVCYRQGANEYIKRLAPYARIKVEEIKAEPFRKNSDKAKAKLVEGQRLIKCLEKYTQSRLIVLDEKGENLDSQDFSRKLIDDARPMVFVIGGALGLSQAILDRANWRLSLSAMTFPHELARLLLVEQVYRAVTISQGKEYHY